MISGAMNDQWKVTLTLLYEAAYAKSYRERKI